jgi:hypothetical protein
MVELLIDIGLFLWNGCPIGTREVARGSSVERALDATGEGLVMESISDKGEMHATRPGPEMLLPERHDLFVGNKGYAHLIRN